MFHVLSGLSTSSLTPQADNITSHAHHPLLCLHNSDYFPILRPYHSDVLGYNMMVYGQLGYGWGLGWWYRSFCWNVVYLEWVISTHSFSRFQWDLPRNSKLTASTDFPSFSQVILVTGYGVTDTRHSKRAVRPSFFLMLKGGRSNVGVTEI